MGDIKMEDLEEVDSTSEPTEETEKIEDETDISPEQNLLNAELERVQKSGRTEKEKAEFSLKKNAERVKELGGEPSEILGIKEEEPNPDDDEPLTVGMYKKIQQESATKTALQLADEIKDNTEKELVKYYLENRIKSSGSPQDDLRDARRMVNAVKNEQIIQEANRKSPAKTHSNGSGAPAKEVKIEGELTQEEKVFLGKPFNLSKETIIKARQK